MLPAAEPRPAAGMPRSRQNFAMSCTDEEVGSEAHRLDGVELEVEALERECRQRAVAPRRALEAELGQVARRRSRPAGRSAAGKSRPPRLKRKSQASAISRALATASGAEL